MSKLAEPFNFKYVKNYEVDSIIEIANLNKEEWFFEIPVDGVYSKYYAVFESSIYWKPDEESSQLFFWKDIEGNLQVQEICGSTGEPIDLISLKINDDAVIARTIFIPNHWVVESKYTFNNKNSLVCQITGGIETTIIYTKVK